MQSTSIMDTTEAQPRHDDGQDAARAHIRAALRELAALNVTLNAVASDDDFGQPNRATRAMDELGLALEALVTS